MFPVFGLCEFIGIKLFGFPFGYGERCPLLSQHFPDKNDLSDMIRIMGQLPVDGFQNRMALIADVDDFGQIVFLQGSERF